MEFYMEKYKRILKDLNELIIKDKIEISSFKIKEGKFKEGKNPDIDDSTWDNYKSGSLWGGYDKSIWFRTNLRVPREFKDEKVYISVKTGRENEWDALNPQFLLFVNGQLRQGLDVNHREAILRAEGQYGEANISLALHGYSGLYDRKCILESHVYTKNEDIERLYYNLKVPLECAELYSEDDRNRTRIMGLIENTVSMIDTRDFNNRSFFESVKRANTYIEENLYGSVDNDAPVITAIGHTHIDIAWLWTLEQTREKAARSFSTAVELMDEYPFYKFLASQPVLYSFIKEEYKPLYEKIKQKVSAKQWEADGAMYLEPDCNLPSGESLIRQCYYGIKFFRDEFDAECNTLWLPDVFGFNGNLPQIMRGCGIKYFATTKLDWNESDRMPHDTFIWKGIDGSQVLAHLITTCEYTPDNTKKTKYEGVFNPSCVLGTWHRYQDKDISNEVLLTYGYGDGGGGANREQMEYGSRLIKGIPGMPAVRTGFQGTFFKHLEDNLRGKQNVPVWCGELYLEYHRGTYTSMAKNKKYNRENEILIGMVEYLGTLNDLLGGTYPKAEIEKIWKVILLNQFHDILPGTAINAVYEESHKQYDEIMDSSLHLINSLMKAVCSNISGKKPSMVVFNNSPFAREGIIETEGLKLESGSGILPYQQLENGNLLVSVPEIPSKGYKLLNIGSRDEIQNTGNPIFVTEKIMENNYFYIVFNDSMEIQSLIYKPAGREVLKKGRTGNVITAYEDRPSRWENWDIERYYKDKSWQVNNVLESRIIETGPVRAGILVKRQFENSTITQKIYIYNNIPRIDFDTTIEWKEKDILLKAGFPVDINSNKAGFDIQYGNIERSTHENTSWDAAQFEVWQHKWVDISEDDFGVSLLNSCNYGCSTKFNDINLTLLKSGTYPNTDADRGIHHLVYSLYPHKGDFKRGGTVKEAYNLNMALFTCIKNNLQGTLEDNLSLISTNRENILVEVIKKSEDGIGYIARIYECYNRRTMANIKFAFPVHEAFECDMLENTKRKITCGNDGIILDFNPYEIKTILLKVHK